MGSSICLGGDGAAVVYIATGSTRSSGCADLVTVLRDGRRVHRTGCRDTRLELVSRMLGREVAEVARARTRFSGTKRQASESVLGRPT